MSTNVMMKLGAYNFSLNTAAYQRLRRESRYGWQRQARLGRTPALQKAVGATHTMHLEGVIYPHYRGGLRQIDAMRAEADKDDPLELVDGLGFVHGRWVILSISETRSEFFADGAPKSKEFALGLEAYGEDAA